ncbi:MAG: DNA replication protein DnaC [Parasphingorhabdus sp.]|jgi:DNA replication protein DnaC
MNPQTLVQLRDLKLSGMAAALVLQTEHPGTYAELSFEERLQLLTDQELLDRNDRKQQRLIKAARFKLLANAAEIDYEHVRGLKKPVIASLLSCHWVRATSESAHHRTLWQRQDLSGLCIRSYCLPKGLSFPLLPTLPIAQRTQSGQG